MKRNDKPKDCLIKNFPREKDPRLWLWAVMGPKHFRDFQEMFGGQKIWIPKHGNKLPCPICPYRSLCVQKLHQQGKSTLWLAKRFSISRKHVYALLKNTSSHLPLCLK